MTTEIRLAAKPCPDCQGPRPFGHKYCPPCLKRRTGPAPRYCLDCQVQVEGKSDYCPPCKKARRNAQRAQGLMPTIWPGVHFPSLAVGQPRVMLSVNRLLGRVRDIPVDEWMLDSGAFTRITTGLGHLPEHQYVEEIRRWSKCGFLRAAVCQDWMCEPFVLDFTGLSVEEHQHRSTKSYLSLRDAVPEVYVMPVLQGWNSDDYSRHLKVLSPYLPESAWVGVGSVCKRQGTPTMISGVLTAILRLRPDLRLHGFGVKTIALRRSDIAERFWSVDTMAWSYAGRRMESRLANDREWCIEWTRRLEQQQSRPSQIAML